MSLVPYKGHRSFLFKTIHIDSHHRYNQREEDATRVARAGNHNHLIGYITYPAYSIIPVRKLRNDYFKNLSSGSPEFQKVIIQHALLFILWGLALSIDWQRTLMLIIVPQLIGIHFLMASNYLQHAQCDVGSQFNHSRNFTGRLFNLLFLNVGYHTAHHLRERVHWTELPALHEEIKDQIRPELCKPSFIAYILVDLGTKPFLQALRLR